MHRTYIVSFEVSIPHRDYSQVASYDFWLFGLFRLVSIPHRDYSRLRGGHDGIIDSLYCLARKFQSLIGIIAGCEE